MANEKEQTDKEFIEELKQDGKDLKKAMDEEDERQRKLNVPPKTRPKKLTTRDLDRKTLKFKPEKKQNEER